MLHDGPYFFSEAFLSIVDTDDPLDIATESELSFLLDRSNYQESFRFRIRRRSLLLAESLIDEEGELDTQELQYWVQFLSNRGYVAYPGGHSDAIFIAHQINFLQRLLEDPSLWKLIKKCQTPVCHTLGEELIRDALEFYATKPLTNAHIRRAVLSACLHFLRQNVGSCFATAPAILIQQQEIERLLTDLCLLLSTGKMKRVISGTEYSVPLSPSWGMGELKKPLVLGEWKSSLGLLDAFSAVGLIDAALDREERFRHLERIVAPFAKQELITLEELIRAVLLHHFNITTEDLEASLRPHHPLSPFISHKKRDLCQKMRKAEKRARSAFRSLTDHALLKAWEFTLASLSEVKMEFSKWNLYTSLGFSADEPGGLGQILYAFIDEKLQECNEQADIFHRECESALQQLRVAESLLKSAETEGEMRRMRAEYQGRYSHFYECQKLRDEHHARAASFSSFFAFLIKQYAEKFPEYFQEIYDAEMQEIRGGIYDDAPAGFRLVYKHGRSDASLWTSIYTSEQYIDVLVDFFRSTEQLIAAASEWEEGKRAVYTLIDRVIVHLRSKEFLESALQRMAKAHRVTSLRGREEKKPWAYTFGGSMNNLIQSYFQRESVTEEARRVENAMDLLIFLVDCLKTLPHSITQPYLDHPNYRMLSYSPTHAFLLQPGWKLMREAWQDEQFTYTWVRDNVLHPRQQFYRDLLLTPSEQKFLLKKFSDKLSPHLRPSIAHLPQGIWQPCDPVAFRRLVAGHLSAPAALDDLDSLLYSALPLTEGHKWKEHVRAILRDYSDIDLEKVLDKFLDRSGEWMESKQLQDAAKACLLLAAKTRQFSFDIHLFVAEKASSLRLAPPRPFLFADTNWSNSAFAFVVNPGSGYLELWRMDFAGITGIPMSNWKEWLEQSSPHPWGVFTRPYEYGVVS